jgi:hypothetical protein
MTRGTWTRYAAWLLAAPFPPQWTINYFLFFQTGKFDM